MIRLLLIIRWENTFIPCVIRGLQHAPQFIEIKKADRECLTVDQVSALLCPYSALNGQWLPECLGRKIPVIAVKENITALNDTPESLDITDKIIVAENYLEAMGILLSFKTGISYKSLRRPLDGIRQL